MFSWLQNRRRRRWLAEPFPDHWQRWLKRNIAIARRLSEEEWETLRAVVQVMVREKRWVGAGGLEINDEIRVTIAGLAGVMVLGVEPRYYFDHLGAIYVYPGAYRHPASVQTGQMIVDETAVIEGESWQDGRLVFSWSDVRHDSRHWPHHSNLVFHELAHHLESLDGETGGTPPLGNAELQRRWQAVSQREFAKLRERVRQGEPTLLRGYGATNPAEFFAVASEHFFCEPHELEALHGELYELLAAFYRQDPRRWDPDVYIEVDPQPQANRSAKTPAKVDAAHVREARSEAKASVRAAGIAPGTADAYFTEGTVYADFDLPAMALEAFNQALQLTDDDPEIYYHRARALVELEEPERALKDAQRAIDAKLKESDLWVVHGRALAQLGRHGEGVKSFKQALNRDSRNGEAWFYKAASHLALGQKKDAEEAAQRALRERPDWPEAQELLSAAQS